MRPASPLGQAGFSLVELLVAIPMTLVTIGAVCALIAAAQSSFRSEPERTDRQQNIRVAMDTVARDVAAAGIGLPAFVQVFTQGQDDDPAAPPAPDSTSGHPDGLEMLTNPEGHDPERVCGSSTGAVSRLWTFDATTDVPEGGIALILMAGDTWTARQLTRTPIRLGADQPGEISCDPTVDHATLSVTGGEGDPTFNVPGGLCAPDSMGTAARGAACRPVGVSSADIVTYRIRLGTDGVPNLERRSTAGFTGRNYASAFEVLARGIEDMRVEYAQAAAPDTFLTKAPAVVAGDDRTLITQVRITLGARTTGPSPTSRSALVSTMSLRAALAHAAQASSAPLWK